MKKFYFLMLSLLIAATAFAQEKCYVYFQNTQNWNAKVWAWDSNNNNANCNFNGTWPGDEMIEKDGLLYWEAPEGKVPTMILISNNGSNDDRFEKPFVNGAFYNPDGSYTMPETPDPDPNPEYPELYLRGSMNDFGALDEYKFARENDVYTLHLDELDGSFKIADANWTIEFTNSDEIVLGTEYVVKKVNNVNMALACTKAQNVDITLTYISNQEGKLVITGIPVEVEKPEGITVYFDNSETNWSTVKIHHWAVNQTSWPGKDMTLVEGSDNVYTYTLPLGTTGMIFNNNAGAQTDDIQDGDIVNGHIYKHDGSHQEYVPEVTEPEYPAILYLNGNFEIYGEDSNWLFDNAVAMQHQGNGIYKAEDVAVKDLTESGSAFFSVFESNDWDHNDKARWGNAEEPDVYTNPVGEKTTTNESYSWSVNPGIYDFTFELSADHSTVTAHVSPAATSLNIEAITTGLSINHETREISGNIGAENNFTINITAANERHIVHHHHIADIAAQTEDFDFNNFVETANNKLTLNPGNGTIHMTTRKGSFFHAPVTYTYAVENDTTTGIENVTVEGEAVPEYYTLEGVSVANPAKGIYIVRRGNQVTRQYIR